jgi:Tetracyclin repressor-like, C-terminal domain
VWHGIRAHPGAIPLVLTRRTASATGFAAADALIAALGGAGLADRDRVAAFHAVLGLVVGAAQAELAGPFTRGRTADETAARIGSVAGAEHPNVAALSGVCDADVVEEDFDHGLQMLLDGISSRAARGRSKRRR